MCNKRAKKASKVPKFHKKTYPTKTPPLLDLSIYKKLILYILRFFFINMRGPPPIAYQHWRTLPPYPQSLDNLPFVLKPFPYK